jgi:hypothetical protein
MLIFYINPVNSLTSGKVKVSFLYPVIFPGFILLFAIRCSPFVFRLNLLTLLILSKFRKAKSEKRKAKSEKRKAKSEKRKAKSEKRKAKSEKRYFCKKKP